jgi:hypothetical protein
MPQERLQPAALAPSSFRSVPGGGGDGEVRRSALALAARLQPPRPRPDSRLVAGWPNRA